MGEEVCDQWVAKFNLIERAANRQFEGAEDFCTATGRVSLLALSPVKNLGSSVH